MTIHKTEIVPQLKPHTLCENELKHGNVNYESTKVLEEHTRDNRELKLGRVLKITPKDMIHTHTHTGKNWISSKLKLSCTKNTVTENEKTSNKVGENICKSHILQ